ncbi:MAG: AarF/UbiB family protein [Anaerolineae bacterium]|nr:AarF/UbiB family protein [Anaerolineae bacterium]
MRTRYRRIIFFFFRTIGGLIWWEVILRRAGFHRQVRRGRSRRLEKIAAKFRKLAVDMGGVLIKVGQFLSARADVLPPEITAELSGLQDEVPPEDFAAIQRLAEAELGTTLTDRFAHFEVVPLAAASLGQVHRAKLKGRKSEGGETSSFGDEVVVKIQRPDIENIIATDLAALNTVGRWLMRYRPISRRIDIPALFAEFSRVLYEEIDYLAEGRNAETFGENMQDIPGVRVPQVVWTHTTRRVLTLEDVYAIKVTDYGEIDAAGVDRKEVAKRVFDVYLGQIFEDSFFHADPHPGNLFVEPSPDEEAGWLLTFVDFGMVGRVPPNARAGLRELAIGLATKDSGRLVQAYQILDVLLPGANLELLAKAEAAALDRFWGMSMEELAQIDMREMHDFAKEFRELVFEMPFQVPQDLIFLGRTVAILAGLCTGLDPEFNFWDNMLPYARRLMLEDGGINWEHWLKEGGALARAMAAVPRRLDRVLAKMDQGRLDVRVPDISRQIAQLEITIRRLVYALLFLALAAVGSQFYLSGEDLIAWVFAGASAIPLLALLLARARK